MRILGIDPGFDRLGMGVIEQSGGAAVWVYHGCVQTQADQPFPERLRIIRDETRAMIQKFQPACVAVERLFFQTNAKTAMGVGMARGVILVEIADAGIAIVDVTPAQVKNGITGWGKADKRQVQEMVQRLLHLKEPPKPDDAADALAIAMVGGLVYCQREVESLSQNSCV